jgi:hypothetical protein
LVALANLIAFIMLRGDLRKVGDRHLTCTHKISNTHNYSA